MDMRADGIGHSGRIPLFVHGLHGRALGSMWRGRVRSVSDTSAGKATTYLWLRTTALLMRVYQEKLVTRRNRLACDPFVPRCRSGSDCTMG